MPSLTSTRATLLVLAALALGIWIGRRLTPPSRASRPDRRRVIANTLNDVYCRLSVTEHGVGVRAVRPIPRGTDPFRTVNPDPDPDTAIVWLTETDLAGAHPGVRAMTSDFLAPSSGAVPMPPRGLNAITISFFMNHEARAPNMRVVSEGGDTYASFRATRDIQAGEELTYDYKHMSDELPAFLKPREAQRRK